MVNTIILSQAIYPWLMLGITAAGLFVNILIIRRHNIKFKREEMDKKLDVVDFREYKEEHGEVHKRDRADVLYIRGRVDEIANHLLNTKK